MNKWLHTPEFKVGLMVAVVSGLIGVMSLKVSEKTGFVGGKSFWFNLDNAAGLIENGSVHVAGIKVGVIESITLDENGAARVDVLIRPGVKLTRTTKIQVRANGILGDKQIELIPGDMRDPVLKSGEQITGIEDSASLDTVIAEVGKITKSLTVVADNLRDATEGDDSKPLGKIVKNIENLSGDLAELVRGRKQKLGEIVDNVHAISETLDQLINDESDEGFKKAWPRVVARLDSAMRNIDEITSKVNNGEGTIGRLINDEETVDELNTAITNVNNIFYGAYQMQTSIDFHSYLLSKREKMRSFFGIKIQPGVDRFYEVGIVSDPVGVDEHKLVTTVTNGTTTQTVDETTVFKDKLQFTALFGKNFYNFSVKGGVIQNTGGVGIEYNMLDQHLKIGVEAYDFEDLTVRSYAKYNVFHGLYFMAGGEHRTSSSDHMYRNYFIGGGLFLTNDDLKFILSRMQF